MARFDERFLDELKSRLSPSEVIGRSVKLRRNGREWVGLSPFNKEKSPSFYVNDQKGFFHDFSSGKHGDIISFIQETQGLSFAEAVELLAREAGMALPEISPQSVAIELKRQGLGDWMRLAHRYFVAQLQGQNDGAIAARAYLSKRGLSDSDIERFGLGYAPKSQTALKDALLAKGASASELVECGLLIEVDNKAPYDRFRDRIIFPIEDMRGQVISFGGRALNPDEKAKYLNGPETSLFHKGHNLYGLPAAVKLLATQKSEPQSHAGLVVVEGYMDVIACQRAGIAAVAPMGTALTEDQMALMWRRDPEPTLCFDGDGAGRRAGYRALERALAKLTPGHSFKFCFLSEAKDPDDLMRTKGPQALKQALMITQPFVEVLFTHECDQEPLETPEKKAGLKNRLRALAARIEDKDLAQAYRQDLMARFEAHLRTLNGVVPEATNGHERRFSPAHRTRKWADAPMLSTKEGQAAAKALAQQLDPISAALAQGLILNPDWIDDHIEALQSYGLGDAFYDPFVDGLLSLSFSHEDGLLGLDTNALNRHFENTGLGTLLRAISAAASKSGAPFLSQDLSREKSHAHWLKTFDAMARLTSLDRALMSAKDEALKIFDADAFFRLKLERDGLRRDLKTGQLWQDVSAETGP